MPTAAPPAVSEPSLRIAVLSSISWSTPPAHYGPWELFASLLTEGLVARGHDVTLFATGNSTTDAALSWVAPVGWSEDQSIEPKVVECLHIASVFERAAEFDIIHNSFDFLPLTYSRLTNTPVVTTIHGFSSEKVVEVYRQYNQNNSYVSISQADRHPDLRYAATIHHGIDTAGFAPCDRRNDNLLYFGRIHPHKGTESAINVAHRTNRPLVIAGIIQDQEYFDSRIAPHIDGVHVTYVGPVGGAERLALLGSSYAMLHLIEFDEPFGLSVVESMASGTPVIAMNRGSMPEIVTPRVTGMLVTTLDEAASAVSAVGDLDREAIAADTARRFDVARMVDDYLAVYRSVLGEQSARNLPRQPGAIPESPRDLRHV